MDQLQEDADAPLYGADVLNIEPKQLTEAEYEAIYTPETRAKAFVLLLYFSVLLVIIPFGSMYICYYHVFNSKSIHFTSKDFNLNFRLRQFN